jgi:tetratricopeptide (TPR) repeat protein
VELLRQLADDFRKVPDYRFDLCETLGRPGPPGRGGEGDGEARVRERLEEAVSRSAELVAQYPNVPEYAAAHARYLDRLGMSLARAGKLAEAEGLHRKAVASQIRLAEQYPDVVAYRVWLGLMERSLGRVVGDRGGLKEARELLERATERVEALRKKDARLGGVRPFLGMAYRDLARVLSQSGEPARAAEALRKAEEFGRDGGPGFPGPRGRGDMRP